MNLVLPQPTGIFGVGKSIHRITDRSRNEKHGSGKRELLIYCYYPTESKTLSAYAPDIIAILKYNLSKSLRVTHDRVSYLDSLLEHTSLNAPLSGACDTFPVLFFFPGLGDPVETYTTLLEEMASQGYVVIAINPPYAVDPTVFPDGKIIRMNPELAGFWYAPDDVFESILDEEHEWWVRDAHFVIDTFKTILADDSYNFLRGRLDYTRMGIFGHSFGGSLALQVCRERADVRACVDMDGIVFGPSSKRLEKLAAPCMFIMADKEITDQELQSHNIARAKYNQLVVPRHPRLLYKQLDNDCYFVTIKNSDHNDFGDINLLKYPITNLGNPKEVIVSTRILVRQFFNYYLKGDPFEKNRIETLHNVVLEQIGKR